ncbi:hypothetical protein FACS18948_5670 [Clostridia bacterium]|nr:hypothetical protein FACS18948_5670 [Clostridia bacterium]
MKLRKSLSLCITLVMLLTLLVTASGALAQQANKPTIVLSYPVMVIIPPVEGVLKVEEELNRYLEEKGVNINVKLNPTDVANYATTIDMMLLANEQVDLFCPLQLQQSINSNQLLSLNPYIDNELKGAVDIFGRNYLAPFSVNDETYAIPCYKGNVILYNWVVRKDAFEAAGLTVGDIKNVDDITPALAKLHELYPDVAAIAPRLGMGTGNTYMLENALYGSEYYQYTSLGSGVGIIGDDLTVVNLFDSEIFKKTAETAYEWSQLGYTPDDASILTEDSYDLSAAGKALSFIIGYAEPTDTVAEMQSDRDDYEYVAIKLSTDIMSSGGIPWGIARNCKNPSEAAQILDMLYTDDYFLNTLLFGIEGWTYVVNEPRPTGEKSISYPEGMDMFTAPYNCLLSSGVMGNEFNIWLMDDEVDERKQFKLDNMQNAIYSPVWGFTFDTLNVRSQASAVQNVITQYYAGLACGELDPAEYLPILNEDLEAAGMSEIIEEAQRQLDAWLAQP